VKAASKHGGSRAVADLQERAKVSPTAARPWPICGLVLALLLAGSVATCQDKDKEKSEKAPRTLLDLAKLSEEGQDVTKPTEALKE